MRSKHCLAPGGTLNKRSKAYGGQPCLGENCCQFFVSLFSDVNGIETVRGLYIATGQYSSLCVCAVVSTLGGDDIEDGVPDREQVDCEREKVEVGEKQERDKHEEQPTNAQTRDTSWMMWMERMCTTDTLSHDVV